MDLKFPKITVENTIARIITSYLAAGVFGKYLPLSTEQFASLFILFWVWLFIYGYVDDYVQATVRWLRGNK